MASIQAVLSFTYHKMYIKSMATLTSQQCVDSLSALCLSWKDGAIYRPPERSWMSDRLEKEASEKLDCCTIGYDTHVNC